MKTGALALTLSLTLVACGPGVTDGEFPITGAFNSSTLSGYFLSDAGGNERFIVYRRLGRPSEIVIDARVDRYLVDGKSLVVARRPAETVFRNGITDVELLPTCEIWLIDMQTRKVRQIRAENRWPSVRCY